MKVADLVPFVSMILIVGLVVGIGVLTTDKFSYAVKDDTTIANETVAFTAGAGTTANDELVSVTSGMIANGTTVAVTIGNADTGALTLGAPYAGEDQTVYLGYVYKGDTATSTNMDSATTAIGEISEDWMGLIIVVAILALILGLTIAGFSYFGRR